MPARQVLFVEASTGGVVGGSLTGILHLIAHLDRARFMPSLALFEDKRIADGDVLVHLLPPLPRTVAANGAGRLGRAWLRATNLWTVLGARAGVLTEVFRRERPALVYLANGFRANMDAIVAAARCGLPVVCHEKGFERVGPLERLTSRWIDACVCMTEEIEAHCRRSGLNARRIVTIYDGIDTARFSSGGGAAVRRELGIPSDAPVIGIVGHIQEWKGQHLVVEAAARARARFPELRCLVVGGVHRRGGAYAERLRARSEAADLAGHVVFTGARDDVAACLDAMDVVVHASVEAEPFGRVLIEAMALGRPVVAPREGGPLVIVVDGETGVLVPPRDADALAAAITALLGDPARRAAMGRAARARVDAVFDIRHHVRAIEGLFDDLLAGRHDGA
jgi:glycosyltransferase involved in cell wall biosynthesis